MADGSVFTVQHTHTHSSYSLWLLHVFGSSRVSPTPSIIPYYRRQIIWWLASIDGLSYYHDTSCTRLPSICSVSCIVHKLKWFTRDIILQIVWIGIEMVIFVFLQKFFVLLLCYLGVIWHNSFCLINKIYQERETFYEKW